MDLSTFEIVSEDDTLPMIPPNKYASRLPLCIERIYMHIGNANCRVFIRGGYEDMVLSRMKDASETLVIGMGRGGRQWVWDIERNAITDGCLQFSPDDFIQHFSAVATRQLRTNEARYREKCVDGVYVPSPDLSSTTRAPWDEEYFDSLTRSLHREKII